MWPSGRGPKQLSILIQKRDGGGGGFLHLAVLGGLHAAADVGGETLLIGQGQAGAFRCDGDIRLYVGAFTGEDSCEPAPSSTLIDRPAWCCGSESSRNGPPGAESFKDSVTS